MRVAFVHQPWSVTPPDNSSDSIALIVYELSRRLARMPGRISHVRNYGRVLPDHPTTEVLEGIEYRRVSAPLDRLAKPLRLLDQWNLTRPGKPFYQSALYHLQYALRVARDLRSDPCDIVHVHNFPQCARVIKRLNPDARVVLHMHCDWLSQLDLEATRRRLDDVDMMLGVSDYITNRVRARFPRRAGICHTLHNAADIARFSLPRNTGDTGGRKILFVGRISPEKGVHVLLQAFSEIAARFPDVTLDLAGPVNVLSREFLDPGRTDTVLERIDNLFRDRDAYLPHLKNLLSPQVAGRVRFLGGMKQSDLAAHYASADCFVLPSVFDEPFGMPLAEAMAAGAACVATKAGAFPEIVADGRTGSLVERDDPAALANALTQLLEHPAGCVAMGSAGKLRAQRYFSWNSAALRLADYYESLIPRRIVTAA